MAGAAPARRAALDVLRTVRGGGFADRALDRAAGRIVPRDRALAHELSFGVLRLRNRLDHIIAQHSQRPLSRLDPDILDTLRLGAYQLLEMSGVPDYAAVSESVELARSTQRSATGFVNGVLQSLRRAAGTSTFPSLGSDPVGHIVTWGSHPEWLAERWIARYGSVAAARLAELDNARPDVYLRLLGADPHRAAERLHQAGVGVEPVPWLQRGVRLVRGAVGDALDVAPVIVQDPAAGLVVEFVGGVPDRVLDVAAAPGGKALALAADQPRSERLVAAADLSLSRLRRLGENVARVGRAPPEGTGALGVAAVAADARHPPFQPAPLVLLDAPCTGTGTFRRHPDGKWRVGPADLESLARLQTQLLEAAAQLVEPGGLLVYATCSLEPEENEAQVTTFLDRHAQFRLEAGTVDADFLDADGMLRVLPHVHGADGAFAARLRREA